MYSQRIKYSSKEAIKKKNKIKVVGMENNIITKDLKFIIELLMDQEINQLLKDYQNSIPTKTDAKK